MQALVNNHLLCRLYNLDPQDAPSGPFIIGQEAFDPQDERMVMTLFLLRRDGTWIDEMAQVLLPDERRFLVFYDSSTDAVQTLETLVGDPVIERHALSTAELRERVACLQGGGYITTRVAVAERYKTWRRSTQH